jgi:hypothetical protein
MGRKYLMLENENLVENSTENVEATTEQTPKMYTQEEVNTIVGQRVARAKARTEREYREKYGDLESVLKAGMKKDDVGEITRDLREFYSKQKGVEIPERKQYSDKDIETLARADADEIIRGGLEEVVEETDRLAKLGVEKMNAREMAMFKVLAEHRQTAEKTKALSEIGVGEDVYNSKEFQDFAGKFNPNIPIKDVYDIYNKTRPKKEAQTMGSMKNKTSEENTVKEFYSRDEALKFTKKDYDKNPALFAAVKRSMLKW